MDVLDAAPWGTDWAWSLPLILLNVVIHVFGLAFIYDAFTFFLREIRIRRRFMIRFAELMSVAVLLIVVLHVWKRLHGLSPTFHWVHFPPPSPQCSIRSAR